MPTSPDLDAARRYLEALRGQWHAAGLLNAGAGVGLVLRPEAALGATAPR
ncbi:hypothetical protein [uncultured Thiodictyon sp.]|nr:hypothetical protein [uncultured Thiodictyon sp.]